MSRLERTVSYTYTLKINGGDPTHFIAEATEMEVQDRYIEIEEEMIRGLNGEKDCVQKFLTGKAKETKKKIAESFAEYDSEKIHDLQVTMMALSQHMEENGDWDDSLFDVVVG